MQSRRNPLHLQEYHGSAISKDGQLGWALELRPLPCAPITPRTSIPHDFRNQVSMVTPTVMMANDYDDEVECIKVIPPFTPFYFNPNEPIDAEITQGDINSLLYDSDQLWNTRAVIFVAREERMMELNSTQSEPIFKVPLTTNHVYHATRPSASQHLSHLSGESSFAQAKRHLLATPEKALCSSHKQAGNLDTFNLDLCMMEDLEGDWDQFGLMSDFHSQNM